MAEIRPFNGIRYNRGLCQDMAALAAPPYDVISHDLQEELYHRHENNVARIDFGKSADGDGDIENRYTRSASYLKKWLGDGILVKDETPALYFYEVEYKTPAGEAKRMSGFICMLRLEEWSKGVVLPHEGTLKGPKADRFDLLKATGVSASQIFSLYSDPARTITKAMVMATTGKQPDEEAKDDDGALHRLWVVTDPEAINAAQSVMEHSIVFIADGHHRYETALAYRDYLRGQGAWGGDEPYNFVPMFLSNMDEEGLTILPTHRLVKGPTGLTREQVLDKAAQFFDITEFGFTPGDEEASRQAFLDGLVEKGKRSNAFGFYYDRGSSYYMLTLKEVEPWLEALRCQRSEAYCNLDVTILHNLVVERVLGINTEAISNDQPVQFEKDGKKAIMRVASGEFEMCFLLNATKVREVKEVALAGEIMPQKSTYFYPKLLTGMVIAQLSE